MSKYRKKYLVEAELYHPGLEDGFSCTLFYSECGYPDESGNFKQCHTCEADVKKAPFIATLERNLYIGHGDWIITGVQSERWPCKPDIFEATYEKVD